jgi:hypothetical protein
MMQILTINMATHNACITGDLLTADRLFTQDIDAYSSDYNSYAIHSFIKARNSNWNSALDDALKVRYTIPA